MSSTQIPFGSALAKKVFGAAVFAATLRKPSLMKNMTGAAPKQGAAEAKIKGQTSPDMPIVRVTDLTKGGGDAVSIDLFNIVGGKPVMGDRNIEGRGEKLTFSSMDIKIDQYAKAVDAGGRMTRQRTVHDLRGIALANLQGYFPRLEDQICLVHMAGARGVQNGQDWHVPLESDADYPEIMVNPVKAPTYNRHFVADGTDLIRGGLQTSLIDSTDVFRLEHIDGIRTIIDDMDFPLQPVKISDDPAAEDEPMYVLLVSPRQYSSILTQSSGTAIRAFQQNAWNRASYGSKHPLFKGEVGMWNNILVKKMTRSIRYLAGNSYQYVAVANRLTATETAGTIGAIGAGFAVERAMLLGAQALGNVYGKDQGSDFYFSISEKLLDHDRKIEMAGFAMSGKAKVRFNVPDGQGNNEPTDHGVIAIDSVVKLT